MIVSIQEENFETKVLQADKPVVVEFGAEWCVPCKHLKPILERLAQEWEGNVSFVEIDVDESVNITMQYQIMGVPTMMLFVKGEMKERLTGLQSEDRIRNAFSPHLS